MILKQVHCTIMFEWCQGLIMSLTDGQDPYKHNFTAEWSVFFMNRINELHEADMKRKKLDVRVILGMTPMSSSTTTTLKKSNYQAAERSSTDQKLTFSSILSNGDTSRETNSENHGEKIPVSIKNIPCGKRKLASIADDDEIIDMDDDDDTLSVISVLRLLTAFEDMLGSLGPKVVDLLSQAVAMEKKRPNLSNKLLMSSENSVFLDTVKEKLKGLIIAGMVQSKQEQTVRKAIRNVSDIVRVIDSKTKEQSKVSEQSSKTPRRARSDDSTPVQNQSNHIPCTNPSPSSSEKSSKRSISEAEQRSDVLKQLETSFVLQGREVLKQHLEELVDVYLANHSSSDTPYLFGLEMGKRLAKMEKAAEVAASFRNIDLKTPPVALPNIQQHKRDDQLRMSNYGSTSSDQQHSFVGGSPFQQQSKHQVQTSGQNGDNLGWMSSSAYGIGDIDNQKSGSQTNHQSGKESKMQKCIQMPSNKYCWQSSQMRYIQQSYQQPVSQYSNASYGSDPANGVPPRNGNEQIRSSPWKPSISHSEFPYQGNQQQSQGQPHFQLQQNTYCQRPNFNMGHQTPYRVQTPMNHNIPPGVNQALLQAPQHRGGQWWPNAAGM